MQEDAFHRINKELCKPTILSFYDPNAATKISVDASSHGLGAVLLQKHNSQRKAVAYVIGSEKRGTSSKFSFLNKYNF